MTNGFGHYNLIDINPGDSINKYLLLIKKQDQQEELDVESIEGTESLSKPYRYKIHFTCSTKNLAKEKFLNLTASLIIRAPNHHWSKYIPDKEKWITERQIEGVVTSFSQISTSADETRYEITLEHKLALLDRRKRSAVYLRTSVPELVTKILKEHWFQGYEIDFDRLSCVYPEREMIVQWGESDLQFINRLLSEVGIWYRFVNHPDHADIIVTIFGDSQSRYIFDQKILYAAHAGLTAKDYSIDKLQVCHNVVAAGVKTKNFDYRLANSALLNADADVAGGDPTTYGIDYRYADIHHEPGSQYEHLTTGESSWFYARRHHEILLNNQSALTGVTTSPLITPGMVLEIDGDIPAAFTQGFVVTAMVVTATRKNALQSTLLGIPYSEKRCFRPQPLPRPRIAGTVPAIVSSTRDNDEYAHIDAHGRYWVKFDFDLDEQDKGYESMPVRLARPYAGDTYGFHFPLIQGTEVAIAFEGGDPERPFIAHALHHASNPDHVTNRNNTRNVIRTAGLNKLRMEDKRGKEHVKLSTEYTRAQLNLGHLVDATGSQRGEGAEMRTDDRATVRAAKGIMLTTEPQPKAQGRQLDMSAVIAQLQAALTVAASLQQSALTAQAFSVDTAPQQQLNAALNGLAQPGLVAYADKGLAHVTPDTLALGAGRDLSLNASNNGMFNALKKLSAAAGQGLSLFARAVGIRIIAAKDDISVQAQRGKLGMLSDQDMHIQSVNGTLTVSAKKGLLLMCGGGGMRINEDGSVKVFTTTRLQLKAAELTYTGPESMTDKAPLFKEEQFHRRFQLHGEGDPESVLAGVKYRLTKSTGEVLEGVTDENGYTSITDMHETDNFKMEVLPGE